MTPIVTSEMLKEAMVARHAVRTYEATPIADDVISALIDEVEAQNRTGDLHIQLVRDEPRAFDSMMAHYGKFSGVTNYFALIGKKAPDLDERLGYHGEHLALVAQALGLNTCWVAMSYKKIPSAFAIAPGEKLVVVISCGYGTTSGVAHKSRKPTDVSNLTGTSPTWFRDGVEAALLAPTALNQQRFHFDLDGDKVHSTPGLGFYTKVDLGIAKYHFELASGKDSSVWA